MVALFFLTFSSYSGPHLTPFPVRLLYMLPLFFFSFLFSVCSSLVCSVRLLQHKWLTDEVLDRQARFGPAHPSMPFVPCVSENQDTHKVSKTAKGDLCCGYLLFGSSTIHTCACSCVVLYSVVQPSLACCVSMCSGNKTKPNCPMRWFTIHHHHHSHPILLHGMVFFPFAPSIFCVFLPKANNGLSVCCCYCCFFASLRFACMPNFI